jgi:hypothetical protein
MTIAKSASTAALFAAPFNGIGDFPGDLCDAVQGERIELKMIRNNRVEG